MSVTQSFSKIIVRINACICSQITLWKSSFKMANRERSAILLVRKLICTLWRRVINFRVRKRFFHWGVSSFKLTEIWLLLLYTFIKKSINSWYNTWKYVFFMTKHGCQDWFSFIFFFLKRFIPRNCVCEFDLYWV